MHSVKAAIAANLEPVGASVLAWLWFGQVLSPLQVLGALLILGAVALLHESGAREVTRSEAGNRETRRKEMASASVAAGERVTMP